MTEQEWLLSNDPAAMLRELQGDLVEVTFLADTGATRRRTLGHPSLTPRKLRLFACACCRQVWDGVPCRRCGGKWRTVDGYSTVEVQYGDNPPRWRRCPNCNGTGCVGGLTDARSRRAVEVAERFADGEATEEELEDAERGATTAWNIRTEPWIAGLAESVAESAIGWPRFMLRAKSSGIPPATQAGLLRDLFGNPFRRDHQHVPYHHEWQRNATVVALATAIYRDRRWEEMPVLADALEEAECDNEDVLRHCRGWVRCWMCVRTNSNPEKDACSVCGQLGAVGPFGKPCAPGWVRGPGPHARGCHVLDLILGKE